METDVLMSTKAILENNLKKILEDIKSSKRGYEGSDIEDRIDALEKVLNSKLSKLSKLEKEGLDTKIELIKSCSYITKFYELGILLQGLHHGNLKPF